MTSRERVLQALSHTLPDRIPVDFLASPEIWQKLSEYFGVQKYNLNNSHYYDPQWEQVLKNLQIDCRVVSYDQFCDPPKQILEEGETVEWWDVMGRSTPARMWRRKKNNEYTRCIFGRKFSITGNATGRYETNLDVLEKAETIEDLQKHCWPDPEWWNFDALPELIKKINRDGEYHFRYRIGTVFELAWQLRGLEKFMMDLVLNPDMACFILDKITDILCAVTEKALSAGGALLDMVYFYDDVASQTGLLLSQKMWEEFIKPRHDRILEVAKRYNKKVMYHSDGSVRILIPELIKMGIDALNPIQPDAVGMDLKGLKKDFGCELSFHGGIDIVKTLPTGSEKDVQDEVRNRIDILGKNGGYILASSHHIQSDTPLKNVLALYDISIRS